MVHSFSVWPATQTQRNPFQITILMKGTKENCHCTLDQYQSLYPHKCNSEQWYSIILLLWFSEWLRITQAWGSAQRIGGLIKPWHWQWVLLGALWWGSCRNVVLNNSRQTIVCKWSRKQMVLSMQKKTKKKHIKTQSGPLRIIVQSGGAPALVIKPQRILFPLKNSGSINHFCITCME